MQAHAGPDLTPATVSAVLFPGGSTQVQKTAHLPEIPPKFDLCLVQDETGSFADFPVMAAQIPGLIVALDASGSDYATCVVGFRDFAQQTWGLPGDWVYRRHADVASGGAGFVAGVPLLSTFAGAGGDSPEGQLEALHYLATPAHAGIDSNGDADTGDANDTVAGLQPTWRANSQRLALLATDAACHAPGDPPAPGWPGDANQAQTIASLVAGGITTIGLTPLGAGTNACVDAIAAGTGGTVQPIGASSATIVDAILDALSEIQVRVFMRSDCTVATGGVITTTFSPNPQVATGGDDVVFTETISVSASAPGGTYTCRDWAVIVTPDGTATNLGDNPATAADETIYERKTIRVPEGFLTGGGHIANGNGPNAERINWDGNVGFLADFGLVGEWNTTFHDVDGTTLDKAHFHAHEIVSLQFSDDGGPGPSPPPANANIAIFVAAGELDKAPGYFLRVCLADRGEPGKGNDTMRMQLFAPGPVLVYDSATDFADEAPASACDGHRFDGGNAQIHSGLKG